MHYIGLDFGNNLGWAVLNSSGHRVDSGSLVLRKPTTWEGGGMRWVRLRCLVSRLIKEYGGGLRLLPPPLPAGAGQEELTLAYQERVRGGPGPFTVVIGYEKVFQAQKSGTAAAVYYGCVATVLGVCEEMGVPAAAYGVGTLKKVATGRGNASKVDMMDACLKRWNYDSDNDNECDALWCAEALRLEVA